MPDPTPVELVGGTSTTATTTVNFTAQAAGKVLILAAATNDYRAASGANRPESSGWTYLNGQEGNLGFYVWWLKSTGVETSVQYRINSAELSAYTLTVLDNMDASPLGVNTAGSSIVTSNLPSYTSPSITPTAGSRWCVTLVGASTGAATSGPYTWTAPVTKLSERYHTSGYRPGVTVATYTLDGGAAVSSVLDFASATGVEQAMVVPVAWKVATGGGTAYTGTLSASVPTLTGSIVGTVTVPAFTGTLAGTVPVVTGSSAGTAAGPVYAGTLAASTPRLTSSISGTTTAPTYTAALLASTPRTTGSVAGTAIGPSYSGSLASPTPIVTSAVTGTVNGPGTTGTLAASTPAITGAVTGVAAAPNATGTLSASTPSTTSSIAGTATAPTYSGTLASNLPGPLTGSTAGTASAPSYAGTLTTSVPPTRATIAGTVTTPAGAGTLSGTLPAITGAIGGTITAPVWTGTLVGQLARLTATTLGIANGPSYSATVTGTLPAVTGAMIGTTAAPAAITGSLNATLVRTTGALPGVAQGNPDLVPPRLTVGAPRPTRYTAAEARTEALTAGPGRPTRYSTGDPR